MSDALSPVGALKKRLIDRLHDALDPDKGLGVADKGFAGVAAAALATVKAFHAEAGITPEQVSAKTSALLNRYSERTQAPN